MTFSLVPAIESWSPSTKRLTRRPSGVHVSAVGALIVAATTSLKPAGSSGATT
jgi:hypothetical protein